MQKFQWSFFSSYFPESAIKTNMLLVKEDATERKNWKGMVALLDKSNNSHTSIYPPSQSRWVDIQRYSAEFPQIVWDSCQSARCKCQLCAWKIRFCVHNPEGARVAPHAWMPSSSKYRGAKCYHVYYGSEFLYISYALPNSDQIRILTSSSIKILLSFL